MSRQKPNLSLLIDRPESQPRVVAPELLKHLRAAEAPEGTSHTFECHVTGTPFPHVSWFKDGEEVFDGPDYVVSCDQGRCTLKIKRLNKEVHSAKFKLKASNPGGEVVTSATLNVLSKSCVKNVLKNLKLFIFLHIWNFKMCYCKYHFVTISHLLGHLN